MDSEKTMIVTKKEQEVIIKIFMICSEKMGLSCEDAGSLIVGLCNIELSAGGFDFGYIEKTGRIDKTIITKEELQTLQGFYTKYFNNSYWGLSENVSHSIRSLFSYIYSNCKDYKIGNASFNIKYVKKQLTNNRKYDIINLESEREVIRYED